MRPCLYRPAGHNRNTTARVNRGPMFRYACAGITGSYPRYITRKMVVDQIKRNAWIRKTGNAPSEERALAAKPYVNAVITNTKTGFGQMDTVARLIATSNAAKDALFQQWLVECWEGR